MLYVEINSTDYSSDIKEGSVVINSQIQNKADTAKFSLNPGATEPSEGQEVKIYDYVTLVSASGTAVVINDVTASGLSVLTKGKFRAGDYIWLDFDTGDSEKVQIASIVASTTAGQVDITLVSSIVNSHAAGDKVGRLLFAGNISEYKLSNPRQLTDVECEVRCIDFTKLFDRKLLNDTWEDVDARYIVNDALNTTINYNKVVDAMNYDDDTAVQAEWIESGDGDNPLYQNTSIIQGTSNIQFPWTNSGGAATFSATPTQADYQAWIGTASGAPVSGNVTFWYKRSSASGLSDITVRVGSDSSNYTAVSVTPESDTDWHFVSLPLTGGSDTGTPDWTNLDYCAFIFTETTNANCIIDDLRITADKSFTMYNFEATADFDDVRSNFKKPTVFLEQLAATVGNYWYIDYERDIHFFDQETNSAPFSLSDTSDNFNDLDVMVDMSQLKNRQFVRGGTKQSSGTYSQVIEGNSATREWILKSQFKNLTISLDDNSSTDTTEAGTTTTNVTATAHGLSSGDYIVNRTRNNAVREVSYVDDDNFTVEAVTGQTSGDTFSKFATTKTAGIEYIVDESTVDYVSNYNEKSIRATDSEATLDSGDFLLFKYNEIVPIRVQRYDPASVTTMKALVGGDGIYDGAVIIDESINSTQGARDRAEAELDAFSNPIVIIMFSTDHEGLDSGQIIQIEDTNKSINGEYVIQKVKTFFRDGDYPQYYVTCASTLFGLTEFFQKLASSLADRSIDDNEEVDLMLTEIVTITISDVNTVSTTADISETPTITVGESNTVDVRDPAVTPFTWGVDADSEPWNLFAWG